MQLDNELVWETFECVFDERIRHRYRGDEFWFFVSQQNEIHEGHRYFDNEIVGIFPKDIKKGDKFNLHIGTSRGEIRFIYEAI